MDSYRSEQSFAARLRSRLLDPTTLTLPVVGPVFWAGQRLGLIAQTPLWILCAMMVGSLMLTSVATALWEGDATGWRLWARVGMEASGIGTVIYAIGWGPTLVIGLVFGAVDNIRVSGARAATPSIVSSVVVLGVGQVAIALGIAPTLVRQPLVHGLAVLAALGVAFTIKLFERSSIETERVQRELSQSERRFRALVQHASDVILVFGHEAKLIYASPAFESVLGYPIGNAVGLSALDVTHPEDLELWIAFIGVDQSLPGSASAGAARLRHSDGSWRWFEVRVTDLTKDPSVGGWVANLRDITERRVSEAALNEAQEAFRRAFDDAPIGMGLVDLSGRIQRANRSFAAFVGRAQDALIGMRVADLTHPDDKATSDDLREKLNRGEIDTYRVEKRYVRPDESTVWVALTVSLVRDAQGDPMYQIGQIEDVTERKALTDRLAYEAAHDTMTGLSNRASFAEQVAAALEDANRSGRQIAMLFIDIDNFKVINDSLGHAIGDELLVSVARRLHDALRPDDVIARFGGDEFVVLCKNITGASDIDKLVTRLIATVAEPVPLADDELFVTASFGIALSCDGDTADALLRHADTAMYRAKANGRGCAATFEPDNDRAAFALLKTGTDLHRALEREELILHYQPIVELQTGNLIGFEALVRWQHSERGLVMPDEFIHLAEETGLIVPIGAWVLETACRQAVQWQTMHSVLSVAASTQPQLAMNVNLSARQIADPTLAKRVSRILDNVHIDPRTVCLELTENTLMRDTPNVMKALHALRSQGVHLSIDDFGTGYSSLSYLKRLPVEALKIDRSFIDGLGNEPEDTSIVQAIVTLAHSLELTAVAEGVETATQLAALRALRCDFAQGYLLGRPAPAEQITSSIPTLSGPHPSVMQLSVRPAAAA